MVLVPRDVREGQRTRSLQASRERDHIGMVVVDMGIFYVVNLTRFAGHVFFRDRRRSLTADIVLSYE